MVKERWQLWQGALSTTATKIRNIEYPSQLTKPRNSLIDWQLTPSPTPPQPHPPPLARCWLYLYFWPFLLVFIRPALLTPSVVREHRGHHATFAYYTANSGGNYTNSFSKYCTRWPKGSRSPRLPPLSALAEMSRLENRVRPLVGFCALRAVVQALQERKGLYTVLQHIYG